MTTVLLKLNSENNLLEQFLFDLLSKVRGTDRKFMQITFAIFTYFPLNLCFARHNFFKF